MQIDPAKHLKEYQERNKQSPWPHRISNFLTALIYFIILAGFIFFSKDFALLWFRMIMETIKGNF